MPADRQGKQRASRWKRKRIPGYTPEADTADELNVSTRTLRKWRQLRVGPDPRLGLVTLGADERRAMGANVVTTGDQHLPALEQDR